MKEEMIEVRPAHRPTREELTPQQIRYVQMKCDMNLTNAKMAEILEVHPNTIYNWNRTELVNNALKEYIQEMRKTNMLKSQRLMSSLLDKANDIITDDEVGLSHKVQLIGQLFTQCGKFAGLEPPKESKKEVTVKKGIESFIDAEVV